MPFVNRQYNSPINLYSHQNIQDILDKEKQMLQNGAIGIDFHHLAKPTNLANSAVLRMLEEEERQGGKKLKRVAWPPPPDPDSYINEVDGSELIKGTPQQYQAPAPPNHVPNSPSPQFNNLHTPSQIQNSASPKGWAPIQSPVSTSPQPTFQSSTFPRQQVKSSPPPPSTVILKKEVPIHQKPAPVFASQPATVSMKGGSNMRGDQKWPPASVKAQTEAENRARIELAKGPVFRPRRINRDYSGFFAQHALNSTYPGYKAPPGTQHYYEHNQYPGQTDL